MQKDFRFGIDSYVNITHEYLSYFLFYFNLKKFQFYSGYCLINLASNRDNTAVYLTNNIFNVKREIISQYQLTAKDS